MRKIVTISILAVLAFASYAQGFQISGQVLDEESKPVDFAETLLMQGKTVVQFQLTDETGKFLFNAPQGNYSILIRQLGDTLYLSDVHVTQTIDLGVIQVKQKLILLQEVTVLAKKNLIERRTDRMVLWKTNRPFFIRK